MSHEVLLVIMSGAALTCFALERRVAWMAHVSAVCMLILVALLLATVGAVPHEHPIYDFFQGPAVLVSLVLLVLGLNLRDVTRLPWRVGLLFAIGALATTVGSLIAGAMAHGSLGANAFKLASQLCASYIGGGENAVAMQKMFDIPNDLFVAVFAVDNIVTSVWMAVTLIAARRSRLPGETPDLSIEDREARSFDGATVNLVDIIASAFLAMFIVFLAKEAATQIGGLHKILYLSLIAVAVGQIPIVRQHTRSAYLLGSVVFAGFFFSIGAISDLKSVVTLPAPVIYMPVVVVAIHGTIVAGCAKLLGTTGLDFGIVSQSLIGGPATSVAVAQSRRWQAGVSMGIVLGVLGYATANFFGAFVHYALSSLLGVG